MHRKRGIEMKRYYPRQVETGEWFYRGRYYDHYPCEEVDRDHNLEEREAERRFDRMRDEGEIHMDSWDILEEMHVDQ
jgi:hypothetical protein